MRLRFGDSVGERAELQEKWSWSVAILSATGILAAGLGGLDFSGAGLYPCAILAMAGATSRRRVLVFAALLLALNVASHIYGRGLTTDLVVSLLLSSSGIVVATIFALRAGFSRRGPGFQNPMQEWGKLREVSALIEALHIRSHAGGCWLKRELPDVPAAQQTLNFMMRDASNAARLLEELTALMPSENFEGRAVSSVKPSASPVVESQDATGNGGLTRSLSEASQPIRPAASGR